MAEEEVKVGESVEVKVVEGEEKEVPVQEVVRPEETVDLPPTELEANQPPQEEPPQELPPEESPAPAPEPVVDRGDPGEVARMADAIRCLPKGFVREALEADLSYVEKAVGEEQKMLITMIKRTIMGTQFEGVSAAEKKAWLQGKSLRRS